VFTIPITISLPVGGARFGKADDGLPAVVLVGADVSAVLFVVETAAAVVGGAVDPGEVDELLLQAARSASATAPAPHTCVCARRDDCLVDVFMVPPKSSRRRLRRRHLMQCLLHRLCGIASPSDPVGGP
jgi:hypothetical protein